MAAPLLGGHVLPRSPPCPPLGQLHLRGPPACLLRHLSLRLLVGQAQPEPQGSGENLPSPRYGPPAALDRAAFPLHPCWRPGPPGMPRTARAERARKSTRLIFAAIKMPVSVSKGKCQAATHSPQRMQRGLALGFGATPSLRLIPGLLKGSGSTWASVMGGRVQVVVWTLEPRADERRVLRLGP